MSTTLEQTRTFWALGDYHAVAGLIADLGVELVDAAGVAPGTRVLDVGAGTGNAALPAARTGATVTALDPTPQLLRIGAELAAGEGVAIEWVEGSAEALPFADAAFDVVLSCVGAMFAPDHETTARELLRVCRPGGTLALAHWTPAGIAGRLFEVLAGYGAPVADPAPTAWGDPAHVRALLEPGCQRLEITTRELVLRFSGGPEELAAHYRADFAPVIATAAALDDPARVAALDDDLTALLRAADHGPAGGPPRYVYEYLQVLAVPGQPPGVDTPGGFPPGATP